MTTYYCYTAKNVEGDSFSAFVNARTRNKARHKFSRMYDLPYINTRAKVVKKGDTVAVICQGCDTVLQYFCPKPYVERITALKCPYCGYENWILPNGGTRTQKWVQKETL